VKADELDYAAVEPEGAVLAETRLAEAEADGIAIEKSTLCVQKSGLDGAEVVEGAQANLLKVVEAAGDHR